MEQGHAHLPERDLLTWWLVGMGWSKVYRDRNKGNYFIFSDRVANN